MAPATEAMATELPAAVTMAGTAITVTEDADPVGTDDSDRCTDAV